MPIARASLPSSTSRRPQIRWRDVESAHAVLIGGAGAYSAVHTHPFTEPLSEVVQRLIEEDRPIFGSCWGHQFLPAHSAAK